MSLGSILRVLVFGGDRRFAKMSLDGASIQAVPGSRHGGNGDIRNAERRVRAGAFDLVVLLRWRGHAETDRVTEACRAAETPCLPVNGSFSAIKRAIAPFLAGR